MGNIGGLSNILFLISGIILKPFIKHSLNLLLSNSVFSFEED